MALLSCVTVEASHRQIVSTLRKGSAGQRRSCSLAAAWCLHHMQALKLKQHSLAAWLLLWMCTASWHARFYQKVSSSPVRN